MSDEPHVQVLMTELRKALSLYVMTLSDEPVAGDGQGESERSQAQEHIERFLQWIEQPRGGVG
jgi:hypothetical protein